MLADGETLSLHSSIGNAARQRRRKRGFGLGGGKSIRLWGWDLFAKLRGAIQLPDDDEAEEKTANRQRRCKSRPSHAHSPSTLSSDAISDAPPSTPTPSRRVLHLRKPKPPRKGTPRPSAVPAAASGKPRRPPRYRSPRLARAISRVSRAAVLDILDMLLRLIVAHTARRASHRPQHTFPTSHPHAEEEEEMGDLEEMGDFDAQAYTRARPRQSTHSSRSRSGSQSTSSGARSTTHQLDTHSNCHYRAQQPAPIPAPAALHPKRSTKAGSSASSHFSMTHDSSSLASPPPLARPALAVHTEEPAFEAFLSPGLGGGGFPSTGFGGPRATLDVGAFLARRGDDV